MQGQKKVYFCAQGNIDFFAALNMLVDCSSGIRSLLSIRDILQLLKDLKKR